MLSCYWGQYSVGRRVYFVSPASPPVCRQLPGAGAAALPHLGHVGGQGGPLSPPQPAAGGHLETPPYARPPAARRRLLQERPRHDHGAPGSKYVSAAGRPGTLCRPVVVVAVQWRTYC